MIKKLLVVKEIPTTTPGMFVVVKCYYSTGGMNYATYKNEPRGYYFSITPLEYKDGFIITTAFSGIKAFIQEAKRFSEKTLKESAIAVESHPQYQEILEKALAKSQLELA